MEILKVNDINDTIKYQTRFNLHNIELANILKSSLEVDSEFSKKIERVFEVTEEGNLLLTYKTTAMQIKPMKKSINGMLENMILVLETIDQFGIKS